jgi:hypothetical protein
MVPAAEKTNVMQFSGIPTGVLFSESSAVAVETLNAMIINPARNSVDSVRIFSFLSFLIR